MYWYVLMVIIFFTLGIYANGPCAVGATCAKQNDCEYDPPMPVRPSLITTADYSQCLPS